VKNNTHVYMWREQGEIESAQRGISIVVCCHSEKLCTLAAQLVESQQSGA